MHDALFGRRAGYKASGDAKLLQLLGEERGMLVSVVDLRDAAYANESEACSSSRVRESLRIGDVGRVLCHLDRPYAVVVSCKALKQHATHPGVWKFFGADAMTQVPMAARYHAAVYAGRDTVCMAHVDLNVGEAECWVEMDIASSSQADGYIRFELLSRADG